MPQGHHGPEPLELNLESSELVFRGFTGEELDPAVLKGEVVLNLAEPTNLKEIQLIFTGTAKVTWRDTSTHHHDHPLFFHDFYFLNPSSSSAPHQSNKQLPTHHLPAGRHLFPFALHLPGSLPASIRTYSGTCVVEYKLKAVATRPGFAADWKTRKMIRVHRGFGVDAIEYNQTLEIENTWPGKVMYAFTIPHKAFAAGDTIPVSVKFSPLAKGVRIVSLVTTIREHTTVHSKSSSHSEARDATVVKYNFVPDSENSSAPSTPGPARISSSSSLASMAHGFGGGMTPMTPGFGMAAHNNQHGALRRNNSGFPGFNALSGRAQAAAAEEESEDSSEEEDGDEDEVDDGHDTEVDVVVEVPVPIWTAPSHTVHPVFITHKIKWSAFIKNPDGHVSELRCALPIHILSSSLAEEARLASQGSRNLLFGESGVLAHSDVPQVDLPAYEDHVKDRVANADTAAQYSLAAGFTPTPWSARTTPVGTPGASPPHSRPASPSRRSSFSAQASHAFGFSGLHSQSSARLASRRSSGSTTPVLTSPPPEPEVIQNPEDHRNWIDSELMNTLSLDATSAPNSAPNSRPGSRPGSRPSSRPSSRPGSRAGSPEREAHAPLATPGAVPMSTPGLGGGPATPGLQHDGHAPPPLSRSHTAGSGFFGHLHVPKPLRPLTSFSRTASSASVNLLHMGSSSHHHHDSSHPSPSALSNALAAHAAQSSGGGSSSNLARMGREAALETVHTHPLMTNAPNAGGAGAETVSSSPATNASIAAIGPGQAPGHGQVHTSHPHPPPLSTHNSHHSHANTHSATHSGHNTPGHHTPGGGAHTPIPDDVDFLSQVPSYEIASRGFLGGGVVPIERSLPGYQDVTAGGAAAEGTGAGAGAYGRADEETVTLRGD